MQKTYPKMAVLAAAQKRLEASKAYGVKQTNRWQIRAARARSEYEAAVLAHMEKPTGWFGRPLTREEAEQREALRAHSVWQAEWMAETSGDVGAEVQAVERKIKFLESLPGEVVTLAMLK